MKVDNVRCKCLYVYVAKCAYMYVYVCICISWLFLVFPILFHSHMFSSSFELSPTSKNLRQLSDCEYTKVAEYSIRRPTVDRKTNPPPKKKITHKKVVVSSVRISRL